MKKTAAQPKDRVHRTPAQERAYAEMLANLAQREGRIPNKRLKLFQAQAHGHRRVWAGIHNLGKRVAA